MQWELIKQITTSRRPIANHRRCARREGSDSKHMVNFQSEMHGFPADESVPDLANDTCPKEPLRIDDEALLDASTGLSHHSPRVGQKLRRSSHGRRPERFVPTKNLRECERARGNEIWPRPGSALPMAYYSKQRDCRVLCPHVATRGGLTFSNRAPLGCHKRGQISAVVQSPCRLDVLPSSRDRSRAPF